MKTEDYEKRCYNMTAKEYSDAVTVSKATASDRCHIKMTINGTTSGELTIRSRELAEQLHFMLGQLLDA